MAEYHGNTRHCDKCLDPLVREEVGDVSRNVAGVDGGSIAPVDGPIAGK